MGKVGQRVGESVRMVRQGHARRLLVSARVRLASTTNSLGLARDLTVPHAPPPSKTPVDVRPLRAGEDVEFLSTDASELTGDAAFTILQQRRLLEAGVGTCWIAVGPDGKPAYMQFLIFPEDNDGISRLWGDLFPQLREGQALLEGAYTPAASRGLGIMAHAMARIADAAAERGATQAITFVGDDNVASLKGCKKAGFSPYERRIELWRLARRRIVHDPLPPGTPYHFEDAARNNGAGATAG